MSDTDVLAALVQLRGEIMALQSIVLALMVSAPPDARERAVKTLALLRDSSNVGDFEHANVAAREAAKGMLEMFELVSGGPAA